MDIPKLIRELTTEEKVRLLAGASLWETEPIERLGIPSITMTDGPHGVRRGDFDPGTTSPATAFPVEAAMASTWNPSLVREAAEVIGEECQHYGIQVVLGPGANGKRSPLAGRNFEYFSEDPVLSGAMAAAWINGVQSRGVGACLKHFVANEQEKNRMVTSAEVGERALREIYLAPFETAIREGKPWSVMCAYNRVNGTPMTENTRLINDVLRGEWGFDGVAISDWGAVQDKRATVAHGVDLEMPGPGMRSEEVLSLHRRGELSDEQLDAHVRRLLTLIDRSLESRRDVPAVDFDSHHRIAVRVAEESMVLLKNEGSLLPLQRGARVAVVGELATHPRTQGGGSSQINPARTCAPADELARYCDLTVVRGYQSGETDEDLITEAAEAARASDLVVLFVGTTEEQETEGRDRSDISLPPFQLRVLQALSETKRDLVVVNMSGSAVDLRPVGNAAKAILHAWLPGQAAGAAIAHILFGEVNPSGRLSETFPLELEHNPSYLDFPGTVDAVRYSEGVFVGYRHYDTRKLPVSFAFGHGLSYTTFEYLNLRVAHIGGEGSRSIRVTVDVTNTGSVSGKEVVQVYVRDPESTEPRPLRELRSFMKLELAPGETQTVATTLVERDFSWYVERLGRFAVESGAFVVDVGASSRDIRLSATVHVKSGDEVRPPLTDRHDLGEHLACTRADTEVRVVVERIMDTVGNHPLLPLLLGMPLAQAVRFLRLIGGSPDDVETLHRAVRREMDA